MAEADEFLQTPPPGTDEKAEGTGNDKRAVMAAAADALRRPCPRDVAFAATAKVDEISTVADSTHTLLLALFLVVLAFFIVMVSYSTIESSRSDAVMGSLTSTFAAHRNGLSLPHPLGAAEGDVFAIRELEEQLATLFATRLRIAEVDIARVGHSMEVSMPVEALFRRGSERLRESRLVLLDRIVATVSNRLAGMSYELTIRLSAVDGPSRGLRLTAESLIVRRAGTIARAMVARGLPAGAIAVAIEPDTRNRVVFAFRIGHEGRSPSSPTRWSAG